MMSEDFRSSQPFEPFSVCFNLLKIRYADYDESLTSKDFLVPTDHVNVFINVESVLKNLSMIKDLEEMIIVHKDVDTILTSNMINLAAHYKKFFTGNGLKTKVYLFNTDLLSDNFTQMKYNEDYRSYYLIKYNENPKFARLTEHLLSSVFPDVKTYCDFIPDVYYVSGKNIEGSLIPFIISQLDKTAKNLVVGNELYDSQYSTIDGFVNHYIKRGAPNNFYSDIKGYLTALTKDSSEAEQLKWIDTNNIYCSLMSVLGDKQRSIDGINGYGTKKFVDCIKRGLDEQTIQLNTSSPEIIGDIFHNTDIKEEFINNFYCSSILSMYDELTDIDKVNIVSQLIDRSDINSLVSINKSKFVNYPLMLEALF